ncbi:MAG: GNAT family N-acetyltransferase [Alphaproteobacteria bacterium]|nr:GNAT family N-acetyltransferase [Alphaproteobacteria bacterium]
MTNKTEIERLTEFRPGDLDALCEATEEAIAVSIGFDWINMPSRQMVEKYWRGVLLVPERELFVARLDNAIVGTCQLVRPAVNNEAGAFNGTITAFFVVPYARGHGLARGLLERVSDHARSSGYKMLSLDVRETQTAAISLYESAKFVRWGTKPRYAFVDGKYIAGFFYFKMLDQEQ